MPQNTKHATGVYASFTTPRHRTRALKNNHVTHETGTTIIQDHVCFVLSAIKRLDLSIETEQQPYKTNMLHAKQGQHTPDKALVRT